MRAANSASRKGYANVTFAARRREMVSIFERIDAARAREVVQADTRATAVMLQTRFFERNCSCLAATCRRFSINSLASCMSQTVCSFGTVRNAIFVVALWRAKERKSRAYENNNSSIKTLDEPRVLPVRFSAHSICLRLFCAFAASASGLSTRLRHQSQQHRSW